MNRVRFYMWHHGMRFEKTRAESYLSQIVHLNHSHVDVIQIHRADNLAFDDDDNDPIVVKLSGRENDSLILLFQNSVNLGGKTKRYRTGFLQDFGYFARNTFPTYEEHIVTHAQAYNASAKIVRFADIGFVAAYLICRGYKTGDRLDRRRADEPRQYAQDVQSYCLNYVRRGQCLRIEEVLIFDYLRLDEPMSEAIQIYRVFDDNQRTILTTELLRRNLLYRLNNWRMYFDGAVGTDVKFLKNVIVNVETLDNFIWMPPAIVRQTIRSYI